MNEEQKKKFAESISYFDGKLDLRDLMEQIDQYATSKAKEAVEKQIAMMLDNATVILNDNSFLLASGFVQLGVTVSFEALEKAGYKVVGEELQKLRELEGEENVNTDYSKEGDDRTVIVCANCKRASCWKGVFYCDGYKTANTIKLTIEELKKLNLENSDYWKEQSPVDNGSSKENEA